MKGTGAKRNVCPGTCVSTGAKFPVAPVESAPMFPVHYWGHVFVCMMYFCTGWHTAWATVVRKMLLL